MPNKDTNSKIVVYQGKPGAYSHQAARQFFPNSDFLGVPNFLQMFDCLTKEKADFAVIPIENSLAGSVFQNYDLIYKYQAWLIGEIYLRINHQLLGFTDNKKPEISQITKVFSHFKALEQCQKFFESKPSIKAISYGDTAGSAEYVASQKKPEYAAIASREAAEIYGLEVLKSDLEDNSRNYTRFLIAQKQKPEDINYQSFYKCSLLFRLKDKTGALQNTLQLFSIFNINLTKIESRPIPGEFFEYIFYCDFLFPNFNQASFQVLIERLEELTMEYRILGVYPSDTTFLSDFRNF